MYIKNINDFKKVFKNNSILENMSIGYDELISRFKAKKIDYNKDTDLKEILDSNKSLEDIIGGTKFRNYWKKKDLYTSEIFNSDDFSTFLVNSISFIFIYKEGDIPVYLLIKNNRLKSNVILYEVGDNEVNDFLDILSSKLIYLTAKDNTYVYQTSNGEDWIKTKGKKNKKFKKELTTDELKELGSNSNVEIKVE